MHCCRALTLASARLSCYNILRPRPSHVKSTVLKHFCKCFILHVTAVYLQAVFDAAKNVLIIFANVLNIFANLLA